MYTTSPREIIPFTVCNQNFESISHLHRNDKLILFHVISIQIFDEEYKF
jgi:hypothetical protein